MPSFPTIPAMRSGLDAQVSVMTEITRRSYDAVRKLSELNLQYSQQLMEDGAAAARTLVGCSDPFQLAAAAARAGQPAIDHLRQYQQQLLGMLTGAQLELSRSAGALMPQASRYASAMAQSMARDTTPAGDGNAAALRESVPHSGNGASYTPG